MRRFMVASAVAATLLATSALAHTGGRPLSTDLSGEEEVPGPGDPDGSGTARITVNPGIGQLCYSLRVSNIETATGAHIHEAPEGVAGPVVQGLIPPATGTSSACISISREFAMELIRNPSDYYVNVHNAAYPGGAVRGQLGD